MKFDTLSILIVFTSLLASCSNTSTSDLTEPTGIVENVTYSTNIKPIIDANCISCHSNPPTNYAPMPLITYDLVKNAVQNRSLINRISRNEGETELMPYGGPKLPQSKIALFIKWQEQGFLQ